LANPAGGITLVKLGNIKGIVTVHNLSSSSYLGRLWGNIGGMLTSTRASDGSDAALSLVMHAIQNDVYVFALCKDHKVRMWLTSSHECVMVADVLSNQQQQGGMPLQLGPQSHMIRKVAKEGSDGFALAAFLCFAEHSQFCVFRPVRTDGQFALKHLATVYAPEYDLIDFSVTPQGKRLGISRLREYFFNVQISIIWQRDWDPWQVL
jgi:nuclear pore complex protein Nup160